MKLQLLEFNLQLCDKMDSRALLKNLNPPMIVFYKHISILVPSFLKAPREKTKITDISFEMKI